LLARDMDNSYLALEPGDFEDLYGCKKAFRIPLAYRESTVVAVAEWGADFGMATRFMAYPDSILRLMTSQENTFPDVNKHFGSGSWHHEKSSVRMVFKSPATCRKGVATKHAHGLEGPGDRLQAFSGPHVRD
jgi:hypothetical protein